MYLLPIYVAICGEKRGGIGGIIDVFELRLLLWVT